MWAFLGDQQNFFYAWNLSSGDETVYDRNIFSEVFRNNIGSIYHLETTYANTKNIHSSSVGLKRTNLCHYHSSCRGGETVSGKEVVVICKEQMHKAPCITKG